MLSLRSKAGAFALYCVRKWGWVVAGRLGVIGGGGAYGDCRARGELRRVARRSGFVGCWERGPLGVGGFARVGVGVEGFGVAPLRIERRVPAWLGSGGLDGMKASRGVRGGWGVCCGYRWGGLEPFWWAGKVGCCGGGGFLGVVWLLN